MSRLSKELKKVVSAKQLLDNARESYMCALNLPRTKDAGHSYTTFACIGLFRALPITELRLSARLANSLVDNTR